MLLAFSGTAIPTSAQSDILLQFRSRSPQGGPFRVDSAGGFVALGQFGYGTIPATGVEMFMWYPAKGALRAGRAYFGWEV